MEKQRQTGNASPFDLEELRSHVQTLDGATWHVERTLKSTPYSETQIVRNASTNEGPFIRKVFASEAGQGSAYETLFRAQERGQRFTHIPRIYDFSRTDEEIAVVMEAVAGVNLREYIGTAGASEEAARTIGPALCDALTELHTALDAPIIHRDIKPGNIIVNDGDVKLIDLDIMRSWRGEVDRDTTHFGTPGYAPPEQYGFGQTGVTADIFAAGMVLCFCCTGEDPTSELREAGFDDPRIPTWMRPVLVLATQFDPAARFQSADQMKAALLAAMEGRLTGVKLASQSHLASDDQTQSALVRVLKYVWNAFCITVFVVVFITLGQETYDLFTVEWPEAMVVAQTHPGRVVFAIVQLFSLFLAAAVALYLCLFKLHRPKLGPLAKLTWRQELPIGAGFVAFVLLIVFYVSDYILAVL